jgi:excinuclease ABC subunit B
MYADKVTESMRKTIEETARRREKQIKYNEDHNLVPMALSKSKSDIMGQSSVVKIRQSEENYYVENTEPQVAADPVVAYMSSEQLQKLLNTTRKNMEKAAKELDFMEAARLRDEMFAIEKLIKDKS